MNTAAQAYLKTGVGTVDQGRLLIMLYDGALRFLQQARVKMEEKDYAAKGLLISRVIDILNELSSSLNLERGGSLATNLDNLYFLCITRLLQANLKMDVKLLDSVAEILEGLRSAYEQVVDRPEARAAVDQIRQRMCPERSLLQRGGVAGPGTGVPPVSQEYFYSGPAVATVQAAQAAALRRDAEKHLEQDSSGDASAGRRLAEQSAARMMESAVAQQVQRRAEEARVILAQEMAGGSGADSRAIPALEIAGEDGADGRAIPAQEMAGGAGADSAARSQQHDGISAGTPGSAMENPQNAETTEPQNPGEQSGPQQTRKNFAAAYNRMMRS